MEHSIKGLQKWFSAQEYILLLQFGSLHQKAHNFITPIPSCGLHGHLYSYTHECTHIHIWIIKNKIDLKKENNPKSTSINILSSLVCVFHWLSTEIISELDVYEVQA